MRSRLRRLSFLLVLLYSVSQAALAAHAAGHDTLEAAQCQLCVHFAQHQFGLPPTLPCVAVSIVGNLPAVVPVSGFVPRSALRQYRQRAPPHSS